MIHILFRNCLIIIKLKKILLDKSKLSKKKKNICKKDETNIN